MVQAVNEIGFKPKMIGGAMVGLQATVFKTQLGPLLNGFVNYDFWLPVPKMMFAGVDDLIKKYQAQRGGGRRRSARLLHGAVGLCPVPGARSRRSRATKSLDDTKIADYIRANTFKTVIGDVKFGAKGEWAQSRMLQVQFHGIKGNDVEQFRGMNTQTVLTPTDYTTGKVIYPYEKAQAVTAGKFETRPLLLARFHLRTPRGMSARRFA